MGKDVTSTYHNKLTSGVCVCVCVCLPVEARID